MDKPTNGQMNVQENKVAPLTPTVAFVLLFLSIFSNPYQRSEKTKIIGQYKNYQL